MKTNPRTLLVSMLKRENELRLLPPNQKQMAQEGDAWLNVVQRIQKQVVKEFGFTGEESDDSAQGLEQKGLDFLRSAWDFFPDDVALHEVAHWLKYNRAKPCDSLLN